MKIKYYCKVLLVISEDYMASKPKIYL